MPDVSSRTRVPPEKSIHAGGSASRLRHRTPMTERHRAVGRPPAGLRGEKTSTYPQLSVRLPAETLATIHALGSVIGSPLWRVVADALNTFESQHRRPKSALPPHPQQKV